MENITVAVLILIIILLGMIILYLNSENKTLHKRVEEIPNDIAEATKLLRNNNALLLEHLNSVNIPLLYYRETLKEIATKVEEYEDKRKDAVSKIDELQTAISNMYRLVPWPECQTYMEHSKFREEAQLLAEGSSNYAIPNWLIDEVDEAMIGKAEGKDEIV